MARRGLTDKQALFVKEYLVDLNATQAAIRAGYSAKNAGKIGSELLGKTRIVEALQKEREKLHARTEITAERTLREYARLAYSDMRSFAIWGPDGVTLKDSDELEEDDAVCVSEVSLIAGKYGDSIKFRLHDKKGALDFIAKHLGIQGSDKFTLDIHEHVELARERLNEKLDAMAKRQAEAEANDHGDTI